MKLQKSRQEYLLSAENIDYISEYIQNFLQKLKMNEKNIQRIRLSMEEILLKWRDHFGQECPCVLTVGTRMGRPYLMLSMKGEVYDPLEEEEEEFENWGNRMLANMGLSPTYSYQKGINQICIRLKKQKRNPIFNIIIAITLALFFGIVGKLMPETVISYINDVVLTSLYNGFLGLLATITGPMILLSVICGIYGIGDVATLGKIGKSMFLQFTGVMTFITAFFMLGAIPFFSVSMGENSAGGQGMDGLMQMVMQILPDNILKPFLSGNSLQIIVIAIALGIAMLVLGNQAKEIAKATEQLNLMIQFLMEQIGKLLPAFIFIILLQKIWTDSILDVIHAWKLFLSVFIMGTLTLLVMFIYTSFRLKVKAKILVKKMLPAFLIALTTSSSSASFGTNISSCEKKMGISEKITKFGIPLGTVIFMPISCITFISVAWYVAESYCVKISFFWIVIAIMIIVILSIALPPIPGGALTSYTILLLQLGLPQEALAVILTIDVLLECFITAGHVAALQMQLLLLANRMKLLDVEILRKEE